MQEIQSVPEVRPEFHMPEGWRWHTFKRHGRYLRFGSVHPKNSIPDAVVICLQDTCEFSEKYYEFANWCIEKNLAFWTLDWTGQGKSSRLIPSSPLKRHSFGYEVDVDDLNYFILEYVKHSCVHPDKGRIPMVMMGHSFGANIGLHYLSKYPDGFECAAFTSPLIGFKRFKAIPSHLKLVITAIGKLFDGSSYMPRGSRWNSDKYRKMSSDKYRNDIKKCWYDHDEELVCYDITLRWLYETQYSCMSLKKAMRKSLINRPCLFAFAGKEDIVDNDLAQKVIGCLAEAKALEYPDAYRDILMETDDIRNSFLDHFYNLIKESIIDRPETLKPF